EAHPRGLEEEPDLPGGRRRRAVAARRQVPRHRGPLQPADGPVDDRPRRGEGEGLAREGRAADRGGSGGRAARVPGPRARGRPRRGSRGRGGARRGARPRPARRGGRRRQGDRPAGQDRARAADPRARERRPRGQARPRRDRRSGMKVAALYDVHAMPWALEAVRAEAERERVDAVVLGGDYLYGPYPRETVAAVRELDAQALRGNCEDMAEEWERAQLAAGDLAWLQALPLATTLDGVLYCHAAPADNTPITTAVTPEDAVRRTFADVG